MKDHFGNPLSTASDEARLRFDEAGELVRLYRGDPVAALDAALDADPDFALAWATRAALFATMTDARQLDEAERCLRAGEAVAGKASPRERAHLAAARDWKEGRFRDAIARWGVVAQEHPRDLIALQFAHVGDFFLGQQSELRDRPLQALRAWQTGEPGSHAVLGMAAFGLEECGDFARAESLGRDGVTLEPRDGWAVHAVAHVCEMQGRVKEGADYLTETADGWAPESGFAYHNWWHLALFALDSEDHARALAVFDAKVRPGDSEVVMELLDASALLWRLHLGGVDTGDRFAKIADAWTGSMDQRYYAFNDVHALMAMLGAGRDGEAARILAGLEQRARDDDDNGLMARDVGLPLARALCAFEAGRYAEAAELLHKVRPRAQRFGGSHAQRDLISLTLYEAALRAGRVAQAEAIAAERLAQRPESPWARSLAGRVRNAAAARAA
ncbi:MAG: tetratricopeptide repeat protein [Hyphomonadaceae bacterium]